MIRPDRIDHVVIKGELASDYNSSPFRPLRSRPVTAISEFPLGGKPTAGPSMVPAAAAALLHRAEQEDRMNILMVSTPATGHINPLLGVARVLIAEGHNVVCLSGSALRDRIESAGAGFRALPPAADFDLTISSRRRRSSRSFRLAWNG
jgi:hypothetical protein